MHWPLATIFTTTMITILYILNGHGHIGFRLTTYPLLDREALCMKDLYRDSIK